MAFREARMAGRTSMVDVGSNGIDDGRLADQVNGG